MKRWMIVIIVLMLTTTSCGLQPSNAPREPVDLARLQSAEAAFDRITRGNEEAWHANDLQLVTDLFTKDAEARDSTFGDHAVGPEQIAGLISVGLSSSTMTQLVDQYIGLANGLTVEHMWNFTLGNNHYTQDQPMIEVDWLQIREDRISTWTLFYAFDNISTLGIATSHRLDQARSLLAAYQSAWSSGDPQAVSALYATEAVREDMVFMERQDGQKAIASFAQTFFNWYPNVQWNLSLAFGEGRGDAPFTGGLYSITVKDLNGQPCEVKVAVLLQTSENMIIHETLYYEPQSLISCGWAQ